MPDISAKMVKDLRETTGAGMMACKKALVAAGGDMEKAVDVLREQGLAGAQKKAGRIAAEGLVDIEISDSLKKGVIVEVNSETDFVARNEKFHQYVKEIASQALNSHAPNLEEFMLEKWAEDESLTVEQKLSSMISNFGENMKIRRIARLEESNGFVCSYIHAGGKIGVLLDVKSNVINDELQEMAKNICMQVAALRPMFISESEVGEEYLAREKEILKAQIQNDPKEAGKPEKIIEGIINGRLKKELKEVCLMDQIYVKAEDGKQTVRQYIDLVSKKYDADVSVKSFIRFETGEGIEKKKDDFASEVAHMAGQ